MTDIGCKFCNKIINNKGSLKSHEIRCKSNVERVKFDIDYSQRKTSNQYMKARDLGVDVPASTQKGKPGKRGYKHTEEFKIRQRAVAIERKLGGVRQSKWIEYRGKTLGSSYELRLAEDLDLHNIKWENNKKFSYIDPLGKVRTYTPDFYLIDYDVYLDPKNDYLINNVNPSLGFSDKEKIQRAMDQNNIKVLILDKHSLDWKSVLQALNP